MSVWWLLVSPRIVASGPFVTPHDARQASARIICQTWDTRMTTTSTIHMYAGLVHAPCCVCVRRLLTQHPSSQFNRRMDTWLSPDMIEIDRDHCDGAFSLPHRIVLSVSRLIAALLPSCSSRGH